MSPVRDDNQVNGGKSLKNSKNAILSNGEMLGVVGAGESVQAILFGFFEKGYLDPYNVMVSDESEEILYTWRELGCGTTNHIQNVTACTDIVLWSLNPEELAVKIPQDWNYEKGYSKGGSLHITLTPEITLEGFRNSLQSKLRVSSNTTYTLRCSSRATFLDLGAHAFVIGTECTDHDRVIIRRIFTACNYFFDFELMEDQVQMLGVLKKLTRGLTLKIVEAISENSAAALGLSRAVSTKFICQSLKQALNVIQDSSSNYPDLVDELCPPGCVTQATSTFLESGFSNAIKQAFSQMSVEK